jgi:pimeloyl-ACP methyl ester carboxylesterase
LLQKGDFHCPLCSHRRSHRAAAALDAQRFAEDLEALRAHFGLGRLTILGHSWGAAVAALYASRFPDNVGQPIIVAGASLRGVSARALIVSGTADVLSGERDWAAALPNARLLVLDGVGHFPYLEAPARFFPAMDTFLAGGWPVGSQIVTAP